MKPRVSISDEALSEMDTALEDAASERMEGTVAMHPWRTLHLEQTAKDSERDRFPIICLDDMAPVVVACIRAASRACDDPDIKRELSRASKAVRDAYKVEQVPTMIQSLKLLADRRMIVAEGEDPPPRSARRWTTDAGKASPPRIGCVAGFAIIAVVTVLFALLIRAIT